MADGLRLAPEEAGRATMPAWMWIGSGVIAGAVAGLVLGFTLDSIEAGRVLAGVGSVLGGFLGWSMARRRAAGPEEGERVIALQYFIVSDQRVARRARRLLRDREDEGPTLGAGSTPCIGFLPVHRQSGPGKFTGRRWSRWGLRVKQPTR